MADESTASRIAAGAVAKDVREYPTGGDPDDFCECGHHEMNHANYHGMPRACNQTGCDCYQFAMPAATPPVREQP